MNISFEEEVKQAIKRCGLNLQLDEPTPGDGNCFSHAIIQQAQRSDLRSTLNKRTQKVLNSIQPYLELKQGVKNFMLSTKNIVVNAFKVDFEQTVGLAEKVSWGNFWKRHLEDKEWADAIFIQGTAYFLEKDIHIFHTSATHAQPFSDPVSGNLENRGGTCPGAPLLLAYIDGLHYQSVLPLDCPLNASFEQTLSSSHKNTKTSTTEKVGTNKNLTKKETKHDAFVFNTFSFAVGDTGGYVCCFCKQTVRRLIFLLKIGCFTELNTLEALEKAFKTYSMSKRAKNRDTKKREINKEDFLQNQRSRRAKTDAKQKEEDEELFLQNQRSKRAKTDAKQKEEDKELFLQNLRSRQAKTYIKRKKQNKPYTAQQRHRDFINHNMYGPIFICCCCHRTLFKGSVVAFTDKVITDIHRKASSILNTCIYEEEISAEKNKQNP